MRSSTERPEAMELGHATAVGVNLEIFPLMINQKIESVLSEMKDHPFGTGDASKKIIDILFVNFV